MDHIESIELGIKENKSYNEIARKVYLAYPTKALINDEERQYEIFNDISCHFSIPIMSIQVVGSAKVGKSFHKNRDFIPGESDLDVAIIDSGLFARYMELVFKISKGYSDRVCFPVKDDRSTFDEYLSYLSKGIFRPDLMPTCRERAEWNQFFGRLSAKHSELFKSINAGIYMSQVFFERKQRATIQNYIKHKAV
jgi:hypothetical protein